MVVFKYYQDRGRTGSIWVLSCFVETLSVHVIICNTINIFVIKIGEQYQIYT